MISQKQTQEILINFDETSGKEVNFKRARVLREDYAHLGVHFQGGGTILGSGSNFGVSGFSFPNFLAFSQSVYTLDGTVPKGPEIITFEFPVCYVEVSVGSRNESEIGLTGYDVQNKEVAKSKTACWKDMRPVSISGINIRKVVVDWKRGDSYEEWILDDLKVKKQDGTLLGLCIYYICQHIEKWKSLKHLPFDLQERLYSELSVFSKLSPYLLRSKFFGRN